MRRLCLALSLLIFIAATNDRSVAADRPNIVFILADDVGCEPLGCYGGTSHQTPNIDALAETGMRFRHCYSMPVCHPTRVCFLTGRYPLHIGNPRWGSFPKDLEHQTVASVMKAAGYSTAVAGKWQLSMLSRDLDQPNRMGFDEYCLFGWHEGPRYHDPLIFRNGAKLAGTAGKYGPDIYVDFLIDFIRRHQQRPFFAFYSMALCHDVTDDLEAPVPYSPGKGRYDNYAEMISQLDRCVGRLVDGLNDLQLRKKTIIVFTGDNGTSKGSIDRAEPDPTGKKKWRYIREPVFSMVGDQQIPGGKGNLTNDGTNVALIANWPDQIAAGQVVDDLVDFSDFLPTFAALGNGGSPSDVNIDGQSFAPRLLDTGTNARAWAFSERKDKRFWVRTQQWKLYNDGQIYDMKNDANEKSNLAGTDVQHADLTALRAVMKTLPQ